MRRIASIFILIALPGAVASLVVRNTPNQICQPSHSDIFLYLLAYYEFWPSLLTGLLALVARSMCWDKRIIENRKNLLPKWVVPATALAAFFFCWMGTSLIYHRFPFSMDEYAAFFQAKIFAAGHLFATFPQKWQWLGQSPVPTFILYNPDHSLTQTYLPVYSLLLTGAGWLGSPWLLNPVLSAFSVILMDRIARRQGLSSAFRIFSVLFLVTSSQFLIMGTSGYSMTSHLFFNLAWLSLYTHPDRRFYYAAPLLGALAIGLHQPVCHILFVLPFLVRLVRERQWKPVLYSAVVYGVAGIFWIVWMYGMRPQIVEDTSRHFWGLPTVHLLIFQGINVLLTLNWQNFAMPLLAVYAVASIREMPPFFRDLFASALLTFIFYFFFLLNQGHGWGYRYIFPVLGNLCLLAAWGGVRLSVPRAFLIATAVIALFVQLPWRMMEVNRVVGRQAFAYEEMTRMNADYVVVDSNSGWYSGDLIRNDPWLRNKPILLFKMRLSPENLERLEKEKSAVFVSSEEFRRWGIPAK